LSPVAGSVGLISNPASGHNRDRFQHIQARVERCPKIHHIVTENPEQIRPALVALSARNVSVLAINGGDGTCSRVLGELLESGIFTAPPLIALLPGGTANMNAGDVGIRGSLTQALERFCDWCDTGLESGPARMRRALMRLTTGDRAPPRYGMFLGAGAVIQGTDYAHREIHSRGLRDDFSLALGTARTIWGLLRNDPAFKAPVTVSLTLDDETPVPYEMLVLAISTLHRLAFGMQPFWGRGEGDIRLTLVTHDSTRFLTTFLSILAGRPSGNALPANGYISRNAHRLVLTCDQPLNLDGEIILPAGPVEISASAPLEFLRL
jgi:diacylglycerol kinase family enzyme